MAAPAEEQLTEADQDARRDWFRRHWQTNIPFNRLCGLQVRHWDTDRVEIVVPYSDDLSAHPGVLHGGVLSALIDTAGTGAVLAGHDFTRGSRISTVSLSVQYLAVARNEDVLATAAAVKRGRLVHVASVEVTGLASRRLLATGQVTATVEGHRPGLLGPLPDDRPQSQTRGSTNS
jgi:uncharacterized protein (TIGR00369 family)